MEGRLQTVNLNLDSFLPRFLCNLTGRADVVEIDELLAQL